jgi:hypothetical protein
MRFFPQNLHERNITFDVAPSFAVCVHLSHPLQPKIPQLDLDRYHVGSILRDKLAEPNKMTGLLARSCYPSILVNGARRRRDKLIV